MDVAQFLAHYSVIMVGGTMMTRTGNHTNGPSC
jgi:hypothetical protein